VIRSLRRGALLHRRAVRDFSAERLRKVHLSSCAMSCSCRIGGTARDCAESTTATASLGANYKIRDFIFLDRVRRYRNALFNPTT